VKIDEEKAILYFEATMNLALYMCTFCENKCSEDNTFLTDMNVITFMHTLTFF